MDASRKSLALGVAVGIVGMLLVAAVVALAIVYTGAYNVAATEEHSSLGRWHLIRRFIAQLRLAQPTSRLPRT